MSKTITGTATTAQGGQASSNTLLGTLRLHFVKRDVMLATPPFILALVVVVTIVIALVIQRVGGDPSSAEWADGSRNNGGVVWSLAGFVTYLGVQSVGTTFPFALALGVTRRNFTIGTLLAHLSQAVYLTVLGSALLWLEKITDHWFVGAYAFDSHILGSGDPGVFAITVLLGSWALLSIGGAFGAVWVRFGKRGPLFVGISVALILALLLLILAPSLGSIFRNFQMWWLVVLAIGAAIISAIGEYGALRSASVR